MNAERWFDSQGRPTRAAREIYAAALLSNTLEELPEDLLIYARSHPEFEEEVMVLAQVLHLKQPQPPVPPRPSLRLVLIYSLVLVAVVGLILGIAHRFQEPDLKPPTPLSESPATVPEPSQVVSAPPVAPPTDGGTEPQQETPQVVQVASPAQLPPPKPHAVAKETRQEAAKPVRDSAAFVPDSITERRLLKFIAGQPYELPARIFRSNDFLDKKSASTPALVLTCERVGTTIPVRIRCTCDTHPFLDGQQVWQLKLYTNRRQRLWTRELTLAPNFELTLDSIPGPGLYYWTLLTPASDGRTAWEGRFVVE